MAAAAANADNELEQAIDRLYDLVITRITDLQKRVMHQTRYIEELEKQLEPEVINEIRAALSE